MSIASPRPSGANATGLPLSDDLMRGADEIRLFLFGHTEDQRQAESNRRSVYHLADKHGLPLFKLGGVLCGRKSTILRWIEAQERAA